MGKKKKNNTGVYVVEKYPPVVEVNQVGDILMIGSSLKGPASAPVYIGPTIKPIRWYQFWRWHLRAEYNRQCEQAGADFKKYFGEPCNF